ncbi:MAG: oligosaccharide flippase family protein [Actinomycetota bacterium]
MTVPVLPEPQPELPVAPTQRLGLLAGAVGRGALLAAAFSVLVQGLGFAQSLLVPRLLGPANLGLFAVAMASVRVAGLIRDFGVSEKLTQEDEVDLPLAYSVAFTLEVIMATAIVALLVGAAPVVAALLNEPDLRLVISVLAATVYTNAFLGLTSALHLRRLHYGRQNLVNAVGPVVSFAVTVPLAYAGAGVWALVAGAVAAFGAAATIMWLTAPLRPRARLDRRMVGRYLRFGWPLWVANLLGMASTVGGTIVITRWLGLVGVGFLAVAQGFVNRAFLIDALVAHSLFPALSRTQGDLAGHRRAFIVTNRITVIWSGFIGFGLAIFAGDLVRFVLGDDWEPATLLFRLAGLAVTTGSIGFSWDIFLRARGDTKPTLAFKTISEAWVFVVLLPAVVFAGIDGAAWAVGSLGVISVVVRQFFVNRMFDDVPLVRVAWREILATGGAAAALVLVRTQWMPDSAAGFAAQVTLYTLVSAGSVLAADGIFIRDLARRVRRPTPHHDVTDVTDANGPLLSPGASRHSGASRLLLELPVPGQYPLGLAVDGDRAWVTCRDSSTLVWTDLPDGEWRSIRLPAYPHLPVVSEGVAWVGLTLAGRVAAVEPSGTSRITRLARTHEVLGTAAHGAGCLVVDNGHAVKRLWTVPAPGRAASSRRLPTGMVRPDIVIAPAETDGEVWVTDTAAPSVARISAEGGVLIDAGAGTRFGLRDDRRGLLWLGHSDRPLVSALEMAEPFDVQTHAAVPSVPFGMALGPDGLIWVACPEASAIVALGEAGSVVDRIDTAAGAWPLSLALWGDCLVALCARAGALLVIRIA